MIKQTIPRLERIKGCLLGGAVGDALGAPVEFMALTDIRAKYGHQGITDYDMAYGRIGAVTDDTQMTLFSAEGIILSAVRPEYGSNNVSTAVYHAYLRWLSTQRKSHDSLIKKYGSCAIVDGILTRHEVMYANRAPGNSCLSALMSGKMGTIENPINDSKGCGGVMRVAPVGLAFDDAEKAFRIGCECAAITHGHPTGYLAAGVLASIISMILSGIDFKHVLEESMRILKTFPHHGECLRAVEDAIEQSHREDTSPEKIENFGAGWVAEEALAISIYCALCSKHNRFKQAVRMAVNHGGDSDSTGAITGNIVGALNGIGGIPDGWLKEVELNELILELAEDLYHGIPR